MGKSKWWQTLWQHIYCWFRFNILRQRFSHEENDWVCYWCNPPEWQECPFCGKKNTGEECKHSRMVGGHCMDCNWATGEPQHPCPECGGCVTGYNKDNKCPGCGTEDEDDITKEKCCETCQYFWEPNEKYTGE